MSCATDTLVDIAVGLGLVLGLGLSSMPGVTDSHFSQSELSVLSKSVDSTSSSTSSCPVGVEWTSDGCSTVVMFMAGARVSVAWEKRKEKPEELGSAVHFKKKFLTPIFYAFCTFQTPQSEEEWLSIAEGFEKRWNYPHCIGALDGKHIAIKAPRGEGSSYFNYKHFHSIILLALVDSNYRFIYVDVGANGRLGDAGVFADSALFRGLENNSLPIPDSRPLPGAHVSNINMPYVIVGDDAFPLKKYLMKPYPERHDASHAESSKRRIHNYRLSRARRCAENAFGILVQRFAVFQNMIHLSPDKATNVTLAALALHNFLMKEKDVRYMTTDSTVSNSLHSIQPQGGNRNSAGAREVRDMFSNYFTGVGSVPWQSNLLLKKS